MNPTKEGTNKPSGEGKTYSRRSFLELTAGTTAGLILGKKLDFLANPSTTNAAINPLSEAAKRVEQVQTISTMAMIDAKSLGADKLIGLSTSAGKNYVVQIRIDQNGNLTAQGPEISSLIASPLSVSATSDYSREIVVGENGSNIGGIALFRNGIWEVVNPSLQRLFNVQVLPDGNSAVLTEGTEASPRLHLFDLNTKQRISLPFAPGSMQSIPQTAFKTIAPNTYEAYGVPAWGYGYVKITINQNNTVTTQEMNTQEGWAKFIYGWVDSQGRNRVDLVGSDLLPTRYIDYIIENIENIQGSKISPNTSFYRIDSDLRIKALATNVSGNQKFMGITEGYNSGFGYMLWDAQIEGYALDDPTNLTKRVKVPNDGDWFLQTGTDRMRINSLNVLNQNGKTFLVASLSDYNMVYNSSTDSSSDVFVKGGIMVRDITNGISSTNPWKQTAVEVVVNGSRLYLPVLEKN